MPIGANYGAQPAIRLHRRLYATFRRVTPTGTPCNEVVAA